MIHTNTITIRQAEFDGETLYEAKVKELPNMRKATKTLSALALGRELSALRQNIPH